MSRKFRQRAEWFPFRRAGCERLRLRIGAALGNPLPQLPGGCRTVFSAVGSNDFIHGSMMLRVFQNKNDDHRLSQPAKAARYKPPSATAAF